MLVRLRHPVAYMRRLCAAVALCAQARATRHILARPAFLWTGLSPEYDGVVSVLDPGAKKQVRIVVPPTGALYWGEQLMKWGAKAAERDHAAVARHAANVDSVRLSRQRQAVLDS